ncbi:MAG: hypothetical protein JNM56_27180 [Planctomycetia bacterium]|nr:hypothetical protein [Planctomycetia bacterium]
MTARPTKFRLAWELIFALSAVAALVAWYASLARDGLPSPGGFVGHLLGVVGFALMLCTELVYTLRKRLRRFTAGSMRFWLQVHIFTGLVGPSLVLLHTGGKFHGLAGVVSLLTVLMVASGFVGRYIYTAAPRDLTGMELNVAELEQQLAAADRELCRLGPVAAPTVSVPPAWWAVLARPWLHWRQSRLLTAARSAGPEAERVAGLLAARERLRLQVACLLGARRLLALWHLFHIPLGAVLFTLASLHIVAALYYSTLSR